MAAPRVNIGSKIRAGGEALEEHWGKDVATRDFKPKAQEAYHVVEKDSKSVGDAISWTSGKITGALMFVPILGKAAAWIANRKFLSSTNASKHVDKVNTKIGVLDVELGRLPEALHDLGHTKAAANMASLRKSVSGYANKILSPGARNMLKTSSVSNVGFAATELLGTAAMLSDAKKVKDTLASMNADITGNKLSGSQIYMGSKDLDPTVAAVRKRELFGPKVVLAKTIQLGGIVASAYMWMRGVNGVKGMMKAMAVTMGTGMASSMLTSGNTATVAYRAMAQSFKKNGQASMEQYVALIGGLEPRANQEVVSEIAQKAFEDQLHPGQVMKFVAHNSVLHPKAAAAEEAMGKHAAAVKGLKVAGASQEVVGAHTAAATGQKTPGKLVAMDKEQEVVGKHTGKVVQMGNESSQSQAIA